MTDAAETRTGRVRGVDGDGLVAVKGIPYGADTSGEGRFRPAAPWPGVRDCTAYGSSCRQVRVAPMTGRGLAPEVKESHAISIGDGFGWQHP